ncbi:hypothetical protein U3516DRAFT_766627 [Neocallimastix sp. 'constans']
MKYWSWGEKKNNNYKSRNKIKNKITSLSRKSSKRNFKFYDVNYEEQNNSDSDSDPSFDFCFNIATNIFNNFQEHKGKLSNCRNLKIMWYRNQLICNESVNKKQIITIKKHYNLNK